MDKLKLKNSYLISFKWLGLFTKTYKIIPSIFEDTETEERRSFKAFNLETGKAEYQYFILRAYPALTQFNLKLTEVTPDKNEKFKVIELLDIKVGDKFQNKGIGSQALKILDEIAKNNNCQAIIGDLESGKNLEARKRFFQKNGFKVYPHEKAKFSGWAIKKTLT